MKAKYKQEKERELLTWERGSVGNGIVYSIQSQFAESK